MLLLCGLELAVLNPDPSRFALGAGVCALVFVPLFCLGTSKLVERVRAPLDAPGSETESTPGQTIVHVLVYRFRRWSRGWAYRSRSTW